MLRSILAFLLVVSLSSCGLNVKITNLELSSTSGLADSSAPKGTEVGEVTIKNFCISSQYVIENDPNNYFDIDGDGKITLAQDNPPVGVYDLTILAQCDDQRRRVTIEITINQYLPNIPITPWARQIGSTTATALSLNTTAYEDCYRSAVDLVGNVYCAGRTQGSLSEANGGGYDALIMKFDPNGNNIWVKQIGSVTGALLGVNVTGNDRCLGVSVDSAGNVYCGGGTTGSLAEPNGGSEDSLIIKLDASGTALWARQVGATTATGLGGSAGGTDRCFNVVADNAGSVYCGGGAQSSITDTHAGGDDAFIMKYSSSGVIQWFTQYGTSVVTGFGNEQCAALTVDGSGNVICSGSTQAQLGEASAGGRDAWVSKMDSSGNITWIRQLGSVTSAALSIVATGDDLCWGISVDSSGNIYCAGETTSSLGEANGGGRDIFWMQLSSAGNINWIKQLGSVTASALSVDSSSDEVCERLGIDVFGNLYCGGRTQSDLGEVNGGQNDIFVMKFNSSGDIQWLSQLGSISAPLLGGSAVGDDYCFGISVDPLGNSYCAGRTDGGLLETNAGLDDVVLIKINPNGEIQ